MATAAVSLSIANPTLPTIPSGTYKITSYGASTSSSDNAAAIQKTIAAASAAGGGTVEVTSGTFLSGPLTLASGVNLQIDSGATLKMLAYGTYPTGTDFITAKNLTNVMISGSGTIDGQGSAWWTAYKADSSVDRPTMIRVISSTNVEVAGVTLKNAPTVHLSFAYTCDQVTVSGITISAPADSTAPNTDGIDTEGTNFLIENCSIACGDDNIAIGAGHNKSAYYHINSCTFGIGHGCSIGSYTTYGVDHIYVDSCTFAGTTSGIRMKTARGRGGVNQYLYYSNLTLTDVKTPLYITSYYPSTPSSPSSDTAQTVTSTTPIWKHIGLTNVTITGATNAGIIWGLPEELISDVALSNVSISATTGMDLYNCTGIVFSNGSSITVSSGSKVITYDGSYSGL